MGAQHNREPSKRRRRRRVTAYRAQRRKAREAGELPCRSRHDGPAADEPSRDSDGEGERAGDGEEGER